MGENGTMEVVAPVILGDNCPEPGIYPDMTWDEYRAVTAMNGSTLMWGREPYSMQHLQAAMEGHLDKDSAAMSFGRAVHCRLLEPDLFARLFPVADQCGATLASGKNKGARCSNSGNVLHEGAWYCGQHAPQGVVSGAEEYITASESERIEAMTAQVRRHPVVKLIRQHGGFETSFVADLEGVRMKGRLDKWIPGGNCPATIVDVKKCGLGGANRDAFGRQVHKYAYHVKAALYVDCMESLTGTRPNFIWIVIEDEYPHAIYVAGASPEDLECGTREYRELLIELKRSLRTGFWRGPCRLNEHGQQDIDWDGVVPEWYMRRVMGNAL